MAIQPTFVLVLFVNDHEARTWVASEKLVLEIITPKKGVKGLERRYIISMNRVKNMRKQRNPSRNHKSSATYRRFVYLLGRKLGEDEIEWWVWVWVWVWFWILLLSGART